MANNCLVTKLKSVVDNDNLEVLNQLCMTVTPGTFRFRLKYKVGTVIYCDNTTDAIYQGPDPGVQVTFPYTVTGTGESVNLSFSGTLTKETTFTADGVYYNDSIYLTEGKTSSFKTNVIEKLKWGIYPCIGIDIRRPVLNDFSINIDELVTENFNTLYCILNPTSNIEGHMSSLASARLGVVRLDNYNLSGDIANLSSSTDLIYCYLTNMPGINGSAENLLATLSDNGKGSTTDSTLEILLNNCNVTFRGNVITSSTPFIVTFNSTGCVVKYKNSSTVLGTYTKGSGWAFPT